MSDFDQDDIRRLDGTLLLVFRELLTHRRATEAARRIGLSQSAVSHALARLRDVFGDPLFIRRSHGLAPTRRALELGPQIEALIALAETAISSRAGFDPARSRRRFELAGPGFVTSIIGGPLVESFRREAPGATFACRRLLIDLALAAVRRGDIDLALGQFTRIPAGLHAETLYADRWCVIAREGHPTLKGKITLETYAATPHVFVGHPSGSNLDETSYDPEGLAQAYGELPPPGQVNAAAYVSEWESAMLTVAASDAIADCPGRLAERHAKRLGLQLLEWPYGAERPPMQAVRRAGSADAGVEWLLHKVRAAAA